MERLLRVNKPYLCHANWITKARKHLSTAYHANIVQIAAIDLNSLRSCSRRPVQLKADGDSREVEVIKTANP